MQLAVKILVNYLEFECNKLFYFILCFLFYYNIKYIIILIFLINKHNKYITKKYFFIQILVNKYSSKSCYDI